MRQTKTRHFWLSAGGEKLFFHFDDRFINFLHINVEHSIKSLPHFERAPNTFEISTAEIGFCGILKNSKNLPNSSVFEFSGFKKLIAARVLIDTCLVLFKAFRKYLAEETPNSTFIELVRLSDKDQNANELRWILPKGSEDLDAEKANYALTEILKETGLFENSISTLTFVQQSKKGLRLEFLQLKRKIVFETTQADLNSTTFSISEEEIVKQAIDHDKEILCCLLYAFAAGLHPEKDFSLTRKILVEEKV